VSQKFKKRVEDFTCEQCGTVVRGNGFTNHCPVCLHSKHVDIYPGDRGATCGGLMVPVAVALKRGRYVITHQCQSCGQEGVNEAAVDDEIGKFLTNLVQ